MQAQFEEPVAYPYQKLQWRGPHDVQIRILVLEASIDPDASIVCRLVVTYVLDSPKYEILSYTWGDTEDTVPITIEDHEVQVTRNLHAALKALRRRNSARRLWVDAICINQDDLREKSNTVRNMHIFYAYAERTVAWLGASAEDSDLALDIITRIGRDGTSTARTEDVRWKNEWKLVCPLNLWRMELFKYMKVCQGVAGGHTVATRYL